MRRLNVCAVSLMSAGLAAFAVVSPAAAADSKPLDVSASARVISMPSPFGAAQPDASFGGLAETTVSVGPETAGVPCGQCVTGASLNNIGLPWPIFAVPQGTTLTVSTTTGGENSLGLSSGERTCCSISRFVIRSCMVADLLMMEGL